jgi:hypothetical protein
MYDSSSQPINTNSTYKRTQTYIRLFSGLSSAGPAATAFPLFHPEDDCLLSVIAIDIDSSKQVNDGLERQPSTVLPLR